MSVELMRAGGEAAFGPDWQSPMARALGKSARLVRMWVSGERRVPDWLPGALPDVLRAEAAKMEINAGRLRKLADRIERQAGG
jgi:hypothetical protein